MSVASTELRLIKKTIKIVAITGAVIFIAPDMFGDAFVELGHGIAEMWSGIVDITWDAVKKGAKEYAKEQLTEGSHKLVDGIDPRNWFKW